MKIFSLLSRKKPPLTFSSLLSIFTTALFFVGLTLTMAMTLSSSFVVIVFAADGTQRTASPRHGFISTATTTTTTTTTDDGISFNIPISAEEEDGGGEGQGEDDEDERGEEDNARSPLRIAFVKPSFTYAAYQLNGFYNFYQKYRHLSDGTTNITTDLNLLTAKVPDKTYLTYRDDPSDTPRVPSQQNYYEKLKELVEQKASSSSSSQNLAIDIEDITDKEVHEGDIFDSSGNNAYDILFLFHQEYVTQSEYDNLKKFVVENGGTIVFNDANIFTVEVKYNSVDNTITLVRGHGWAYDDDDAGIGSAWHSDSERWLNENQQWIGSNFIEIPASDDEDVTFSNNPFNYSHSEEQIVTNPNAEIILDFMVMGDVSYEIDKDDIDNVQDFPGFGKVAVYEMMSGKGKVINIGIFAHKLEDNEAFLEFYDKEILPRALR
jgi:hypothetical protein